MVKLVLDGTEALQFKMQMVFFFFFKNNMSLPQLLRIIVATISEQYRLYPSSELTFLVY